MSDNFLECVNNAEGDTDKVNEMEWVFFILIITLVVWRMMPSKGVKSISAT